MPAKFSSFEHVGIISLNSMPSIRLIGPYRPPGNQCAQDFSNDLTSLLQD